MEEDEWVSDVLDGVSEVLSESDVELGGLQLSSPILNIGCEDKCETYEARYEESVEIVEHDIEETVERDEVCEECVVLDHGYWTKSKPIKRKGPCSDMSTSLSLEPSTKRCKFDWIMDVDQAVKFSDWTDKKDECKALKWSADNLSPISDITNKTEVNCVESNATEWNLTPRKLYQDGTDLRLLSHSSLRPDHLCLEAHNDGVFHDSKEDNSQVLHGSKDSDGSQSQVTIEDSVTRTKTLSLDNCSKFLNCSDTSSPQYGGPVDKILRLELPNIPPKIVKIQSK